MFHGLIIQEAVVLSFCLLQCCIFSIAVVGLPIDLLLADPPCVVDTMTPPSKDHIPLLCHKKNKKGHLCISRLKDVIT
jgi:hypothetical protein